MTTPDLPVELWLNILAYLPRTALHKMIGVNRLLFELALNDLYEEVRFIADDRDMVKTFEQLKHLGIARRVRHLYMRPAFLPGMDENATFAFRLERQLVPGLSLLEKLRKKPARTPNSIEATVPDRLDPTRRILETARNAVKSCPNLHEISIVVHDLAITPSFTTFLDSLWSSDSIGPNVKKISIDTTVTKLPLLLKPLTKRAKSLTNLEDFDINISISRIKETPTDWYHSNQAFLSFLNAFKMTLTTFTFSSLVVFDLATLFDSFPRLLKLKKFEFLAVFNINSIPNTEGLTRFISRHRSTLETLIVKPNARQTTSNSSDDSYYVWVNHKGTAERLNSFSQLALPKLHTLEISFLNSDNLWTLGSRSSQPLLPSLSQVTPNLKKLAITHINLLPRRIIEFIKVLAQREGGCLLEELIISCAYISPSLFDALAKNLPHLQRLTIRYKWISTKIDDDSSFPSYANFLGDSAIVSKGFSEMMQARRYPGWQLKYIRLVSPHSCGDLHPDPSVMKIVAESLLKDIVLDFDLTCLCNFDIDSDKLRSTS